jgi:hypothetical protein
MLTASIATGMMTRSAGTMAVAVHAACLAPARRLRRDGAGVVGGVDAAAGVTVVDVLTRMVDAATNRP